MDMSHAGVPGPGLINISDAEFADISNLVRSVFGISLSEKKKALVRGRLSSHLRSSGFSNFRDYFDSITTDITGNKLLGLVDRISTNHSFFFRELDHFNHVIAQAVPVIEAKLLRNQGDKLRIWSAGCAAGEEAYTMAMILSEYARANRPAWEVAILATDISVSALEQAGRGAYPEHKLDAVPERYRGYFHRIGDTDEYLIDESIREMVLTRRLNLMSETYPFREMFHIVFCRNVMIYFDPDTKETLIERISRHVHEGGFLYIGHSETLGRSPHGWEYVKPTVYRRCKER